MEDLSNGCKVSILEWALRGRSVCGTTRGLYCQRVRKQSFKVEKGFVRFKVSTKGMV